MPYTRRSGLRIHYRVAGSGHPLVLIHGYSSSGLTNWVSSGWVELLSSHHTLLIPDLRGHGRSQKPYATTAYSVPAMAKDVLAVMDREGFRRAPVFGYSMGGMVALELLLNHPDRVEAAIIGGMGSYFPRARGRFSIERQAAASTAPRRKPVELARFLGGYFSQFDPIALDRVFRGVFRGNQPVDPARLHEIHVPVLVAAGTRDPFFPPAHDLAAAIPGARFVTLAEEGHLSAIRNPLFRAEVEAFLGRMEAGLPPPRVATE
ncbi:MAG: alpha/beta fold hydrolase [Dehalococcoidia bacterium]|nr:alpha/beta fold hydrolase [Dehalococcoidia bacterium]